MYFIGHSVALETVTSRHFISLSVVRNTDNRCTHSIIVLSRPDLTHENNKKEKKNDFAFSIQRSERGGEDYGVEG
jgi:hypothetical protein